MNGRRLLVLAALAAVTACSSSSKSNLTVSAKAVTATAPVAATSLDLGNGISLDRVRIVVRKLKLEGTLAAADGGTGSTSGTPSMSEGGSDGKTDVEKEHDGENEPVLGPFLVDLSAATLAAGIQQAFDGVVPQGTFHELKFAVGPLSADKVGTDAKLAEMAALNASIAIDGTIDGTAFTFVSSLTAQAKKEGDFVVSDAAGNNVTLSIDPKGWFGGAGAARLDPSVAANKSAIEANIKASVDVFEDDDKSGHENHHGDHGGADGGSGHH
jgi:hypothetical protein